MKFKTVQRNQLFFGKYRYCISFYLRNASVLRDLDPIKIIAAIRYRNSWAPYQNRQKIEPREENELIDACDYLSTRQHPFKRMVGTHHMYLYTNHVDDFKNLKDLNGVTVFSRTEANVSLRSDAVTLKNPQHSYRTFFKERWLKDHELRNMREYFQARSDQFRLSPGFANLVKGKQTWLMSNYFVDHNEPRADLLINMAIPGIVKKTLPIVARN